MEDKKKILIIDDEESIRFTFESFLTDEGYEVTTAKDYDEDFSLIFHLFLLQANQLLFS